MARDVMLLLLLVAMVVAAVVDSTTVDCNYVSTVAHCSNLAPGDDDDDVVAMVACRARVQTHDELALVAVVVLLL